jgi:hypothetical protein
LSKAATRWQQHEKENSKKAPSPHVTKKCGHHRIHQLFAVHIQSESAAGV